MNFLPYPEFIEKFVQKIAQESVNSTNENKEVSYHTQKFLLGQQNVDYNTKVQLKFKMNCGNNKFAIVNERYLQFQFQWKESFSEAQVKEHYAAFQKLVKQIVNVASMLDKEMRDLFKEFKPETSLGNSSFNIIIKLPKDYQEYWITFQEYLMSYFAKIQKEEIVVLKIKSDMRIKDLIADEIPVNIFYSFLKNCQIEIYSLLNKLINQETKEIFQSFTSDNLEEKKSNDLILLLYKLTQSEIEVNMESFTEDELIQLGLFPFQPTPINLDFQPAIIHKIKLFFRDIFTGTIKINMVNSQTLCQIKLETNDDLSQLFDIFIQSTKDN